MIGIDPQLLPDKVGEVKATLRKYAVRKIYRMSGYQRAIERTSMKNTKGASPAGTPPHTHPRMSKKGNTLPAFPQFIQFKVEEKGLQSRSVVGPTKPGKGRRSNWAEGIGKTHEFGGTTTVEKRVYRNKEGQFVTAIDHVPLYGEGGRPTFPFRVLLHKKPRMTKKGKPYKKDREYLKISYEATYPKRPFAAPALRKTTAATRQGKFG
jgi:hypothetical protein